VRTLGRQSGTGHHRHDAVEEAVEEAQPEELVKGMNMVLQSRIAPQKAGVSYPENMGMARADVAKQEQTD
jgi:hypothetical protein